MVSLYVEGEPVDLLGFILGSLQLFLLPGLVVLFVVLFVIWLFFQAADPENQRIQTERAPTIIELAWIIPLILIFITLGAFVFTPALVVMLFLRMYLVKLYQLFNPDWRTDGTSVGMPALEEAVEALNTLPTKDEITEDIAEDIAERLVSEYQDEIGLLRRALRAWPIGPIIEFHKINHKKKWFALYVYFVIVPLLIISLLISIIVMELASLLGDEIMDMALSVPGL